MSEKTFSNLQELTGHESGAIQYSDGTIWIGNWSGIEGMPRELSPIGMIGLGEPLTAERCSVPIEVKLAMQGHERGQGTPVNSNDFCSWRVNGDTVVTIQDDWA